MSHGDPGPYMNDDSDIWVPRTVPWKDARAVALSGVQEYGFVLRYVGKSEATLYGFSPACEFDCDEACHLAFEDRDDFAPDLADACLVPAWHFRQGDPYDFEQERTAALGLPR